MASNSYTPEERAAYMEQQRSKQEKMLLELAESWKAHPEDIAEYAAFSGRFYKYSSRNTALIYQQNHGALFCGSYRFYANNGYHVRKGEKGMLVLVHTPVTLYRADAASEWQRLSDAPPATRQLAAAGAIETRQQAHFKCGYVFDIGQTDCPKEDYPKLMGIGYDSAEHARIYETVREYCRTVGISVSEQSLHSAGLRGTYASQSSKITVNEILGDTQRLSTLLHEMAHGVLPLENKSTACKEFEADALSVMLGSRFGIEPTETRRQHLADCYKTYLTELEADGKEITPELLFADVRKAYAAHADKLTEAVGHTLEREAPKATPETVQEKDMFSPVQLQEPQPAAEQAVSRLFVDMDGTLARFHDEVKYLERMVEPGFFRELKPFENTVSGLRTFMEQHPETEVFVLSAALPEESCNCIEQKNDWLDRYLPEIDRKHRIFPAMGADKTKSIPGGIRPTDILLDDYNKNLAEWQSAGGRSVKFVNNINDRALNGKRWEGERLSYDLEPTAFADKAAALCTVPAPQIPAERLEELENAWGNETRAPLTQRWRNRLTPAEQGQVREWDKRYGGQAAAPKPSQPFYDREKLLEIPIEQVCERLNIPVRKTGGKSVCAVRKEKTPSCVLYPDNTFCDFGNANRGGDVINFVQYAENLDWHSAARRLAEEFGIQPENQESAKKRQLSDREYAKIGIQADMATKNFDFDLEKYDLKQTAEYADRYRMPVQELAEQHPVVYHNMLKNRAVPFLYEQRSLYYDSLLTADRFCKAMGADVRQSADWKELEQEAASLSRAEQLMKRAITEPKRLKFTPRKYDPAADLEGIRSGKIEFEIGSCFYRELKEQTGKPSFRKVPTEQYLKEIWHQETPHAAFYQGDVVNVAYDPEKEQELFSPNALKHPAEQSALEKLRELHPELDGVMLNAASSAAAYLMLEAQGETPPLELLQKLKDVLPSLSESEKEKLEQAIRGCAAELAPPAEEALMPAPEEEPLAPQL